MPTENGTQNQIAIYIGWYGITQVYFLADLHQQSRLKSQNIWDDCFLILIWEAGGFKVIELYKFEQSSGKTNEF